MEELEMGQAMGKKLSMSDRPPAFNRMLSTASSEDEREIHQLQVSMTNHRDGR
jgi:hypothetical protein